MNRRKFFALLAAIPALPSILSGLRVSPSGEIASIRGFRHIPTLGLTKESLKILNKTLKFGTVTPPSYDNAYFLGERCRRKDRMKYKVKSATNGTGIRTYRAMKRGKVKFRVRAETLSQYPHGMERVPHKRAVEILQELDKFTERVLGHGCGLAKSMPPSISYAEWTRSHPAVLFHDPAITHARETAQIAEQAKEARDRAMRSLHHKLSTLPAKYFTTEPCDRLRK